jgi:VWFA-related protein
LAMKRAFSTILAFFLLINLSQTALRPQEKPKQEVTVTAVEVPVRVLRKGEPVKNLTKEDFEVYENGVKQEITAFQVISRQISLEKGILSEELKITPKPRLFILIFNVFDYTNAVGEGIDYFFQNVFRPQDRLIILTEDRVLNIEHDKDLTKVATHLKETLKAYKSYSTMAITKAYTDLSTEGEQLLLYLKGLLGTAMDVEQYIIRFYNDYERIWSEYKRQFFTLDMDLYRNMVQRVQKLEGEKWAICFEQREMFPTLKNQGPLESEIRKLTETWVEPQAQVHARNIQDKQWELQRSMNITENFPGDRIRDLFMGSGITFHLILMKSMRILLSPDFELTEVAQDYEDCFKRISNSTGGYATFSNKVMDALKEASVKEDFHYLVVYSPRDPSANKERNIEVKVKKENTDVISLKRFIAPGQPMISIADFKAGDKNVKFSLKSYARVSSEGKMHGAADVKIVIFDDKSEQVFSDGKTLDLLKEETHISLNFNVLNSGSYFIIVDAYDRVSGGKDVYSSAIKL